MPSKNILAADASTLMFGVKMVFPVLQSVAVLLGELLWASDFLCGSAAAALCGFWQATAKVTKSMQSAQSLFFQFRSSARLSRHIFPLGLLRFLVDRKMPSKNILAADASTLMFGVKMVFPVLQSVAVLLGELLWGFRFFVWISCCSSMWILASYGQGDEIDAIRSVAIFSISFFCSIITPHLPAWFAALFGGQHPVAAHAPPAHLFFNATIIMIAVLLGLLFVNNTSASEKTELDSIQGRLVDIERSVEHLKVENAQLKMENAQLKMENAQLKVVIEEVKRANLILMRENMSLKRENSFLRRRCFLGRFGQHSADLQD
uniref:Uncharacterized protein n=1 Tax=Ditylenchus dipsaci TaxID=166011 RepID=A0A915CZ27_9BILA